MGNLPAGGSATITIVLEPSAPGTYSLWALAASADGDVDPSNDHASVDLLVDPCYQEVMPATMAFPAGGGPGSIQVISPEGCAWSTALHASWIAVTPPASGQGPGSVAFTVAPNPSGQPRTGTISVGPAVLTVEQAAAAPALRLLSPNGGEELAAGADLVITWEEPSTVRSIAIDFSYDGGSTWKRYVAGVLTPTYPMTVPAPPGNRTKCLVRLTAYDEHGRRLATDRSDAVFSIVVVRLQAPNGGESLHGGQQVPVQWALHGTLRPVAQVIVSYTRDGGTTWKKLAALGPDATSWDWTIPALPRAFSRCKVKLALRDVQGKSVGSDVSDGWFLIDAP